MVATLFQITSYNEFSIADAFGARFAVVWSTMMYVDLIGYPNNQISQHHLPDLQQGVFMSQVTPSKILQLRSKRISREAKQDRKPAKNRNLISVLLQLLRKPV